MWGTNINFKALESPTIKSGANKHKLMLTSRQHCYISDDEMNGMIRRVKRWVDCGMDEDSACQLAVHQLRILKYMELRPKREKRPQFEESEEPPAYLKDLILEDEE